MSPDRSGPMVLIYYSTLVQKKSERPGDFQRLLIPSLTTVDALKGQGVLTF